VSELLNLDRLRQCNGVDCGVPAAVAAPPAIPKESQAIDYMAKDYDSFLRAMIDLLPNRVPGWKDRTEADLGMAILELLAYAGDEISYYQDRVAAEGYLRTAGQYDSVRRLLSLVDYRLDPGTAAEVVLTVAVSAPTYVAAGFQARTAFEGEREAVTYETSDALVAYPELNTIALAADAPANVAATRVVLAAELDAAFLPVGALLLVTGPGVGEWGRIASPVVVDPVAHTTTVTFAAPLTGRYAAAVARARGNGVPATHGASRTNRAPGTGLPNQQIALDFAPLTYTTDATGTPRTSLRVDIDGERWHEVEDFIESGPTDPHYRTSRDNIGFVTVHFGDGVQGRVPAAPPVTLFPDEGNVVVTYRTGIGNSGLVAADTLKAFDSGIATITAVTNPLPSTNAREPQSLDDARLLGPRQLQRQNRTVIAADYGEVLLQNAAPGLSVKPLHVKASFRDTGSWTTAVVSVDMADRRPLAETPGLLDALTQALAAARIAGSDVQITDARYAPLHVGLVVNLRPAVSAREVRQHVETVLRQFFAPERFDFGQAVYLSDLYAAVMKVESVESLAVTRFKRLGDRYPDRERDGLIPIGPFEIARCDADPAHPEHGVLYVRTCGGREG
jgi:hypothetical protein